MGGIHNGCFIIENTIQTDDLGIPPFMETQHESKTLPLSYHQDEVQFPFRLRKPSTCIPSDQARTFLGFGR